MFVPGQKAVMLAVLLALLGFSLCVSGQPRTNTIQARDEPPPPVLYRGDTRSLAEIKRQGGFRPRGDLADEAGYSVYSHMRGVQGGGAPENSVYASTTTDPKIAVKALGGQKGYVYKVSPTENMFSVQDTLKNHYLYKDQKEYVALGGVRLDQISEVAEVKKPSADEAGKNYNPELKFKSNADYNEATYRGRSVSGRQPELAGFTPGHPALEESEWKALSGKPLKEPGEKLLAQARDKGWEPPTPVRKTRPPKTPKTPKKPPTGEIPDPGTPGTIKPIDCKRDGSGCRRTLQELKGLAQKRAEKLFPSLMRKSGLSKLIDKGVGFPKLLEASNKFKVKTPDFKLRAGGVLRGAALALYAENVRETFSRDSSTLERTAAVTSLTPFLGCATQAEADVEGGRNRVVTKIDYALCSASDGTALVGLWPVSLVIEGVRVAIQLLEEFLVGAEPPSFEEMHSEYLKGWKAYVDTISESVKSPEFKQNLTARLDAEKTDVVFLASQAAGTLYASSLETSANETTEEGSGAPADENEPEQDPASGDDEATAPSDGDDQLVRRHASDEQPSPTNQGPAGPQESDESFGLDPLITEAFDKRKDLLMNDMKKRMKEELKETYTQYDSQFTGQLRKWLYRFFYKANKRRANFFTQLSPVWAGIPQKTDKYLQGFQGKFKRGSGGGLEPGPNADVQALEKTLDEVFAGLKQGG